MTLPTDALTVVADSAKVGELTDPVQPVSTAKVCNNSVNHYATPVLNIILTI